jgi:hypothetical protein
LFEPGEDVAARLGGLLVRRGRVFIVCWHKSFVAGKDFASLAAIARRRAESIVSEAIRF